MTNKFKVGDMVRILNVVDSEFKEGAIGVIEDCDHSGYREWKVTVNGDYEWFDADEFELVETTHKDSERIAKLEEEVAELKLIVAQIRKPSTVVEEALQGADYSTQPDETILTFEGKQYKKVDREAREGDVVVLNDVGDSDYFETNKPYKVQRDIYINGVGKHTNYKEAHPVYVKQYNRTPETVDVYELIVEDKPKTANQLRAEIIEKAKGFVETKTHYLQNSTLCNGGFVAKERENPNLANVVTKCDFIVNPEKRTVVALIKYRDNTLRVKGIAKCDPSDVFNEHIGKAIALGRALGLDVSEFEQAVQPSLAIGQIVYHPGWEETCEIAVSGHYSMEGSKCAIDSTYANESTIINDTNAQY